MLSLNAPLWIDRDGGPTFAPGSGTRTSARHMSAMGVSGQVAVRSFEPVR